MGTSTSGFLAALRLRLAAISAEEVLLHGDFRFVGLPLGQRGARFLAHLGSLLLSLRTFHQTRRSLAIFDDHEFFVLVFHILIRTDFECLHQAPLTSSTSVTVSAERSSISSMVVRT